MATPAIHAKERLNCWKWGFMTQERLSSPLRHDPSTGRVIVIYIYSLVAVTMDSMVNVAMA